MTTTMTTTMTTARTTTPRHTRQFDAPSVSRIVRAAPARGSLAHPHLAEPRATLKAFRYWLREQAHTAGPKALAGVAGSANADPVANWLRRDRGYTRVCVRAGDSQPWPAGRQATFQAFDKRGRALGVGYCDIGLTLTIDWLDGSVPGQLLTIGACLDALDAMEQAWPPTFATPRQARSAAERAGEGDAQ